jgi:hypothetical protein
VLGLHGDVSFLEGVLGNRLGCDQLFSDAVTLSGPCATLLGNPPGTGTGFLLAASFLGLTPELSTRGTKKRPTFVSAPDLFPLLTGVLGQPRNF